MPDVSSRSAAVEKNTAVYQDNVPHSLDKLQGARQKVILMMLKQQTSEAVQHVFVENK